LIDLEVLKYELDSLGLDARRVGIDRNAMIIEQSDKESESQLKLRERLSSTLCGVGSAVARRAMRGSNVKLAGQFARELSWLGDFITDVSEEANNAIDCGKSVLVEGTQGFGLSLYHSESYPKATSRDTTASAFLSEVGLSPRLVTEIVLVLRTFPIRVAGEQAGPLRDEIKWEDLQAESGYPHPIQEMTTVSKKLRRVGRFDWELAAKAIQFNRPSRVAINGLDLFDYLNRALRCRESLTARARTFLWDFEERFQTPVSMCGTGPRVADIAVPHQVPRVNEEAHAEILG
jgi:adenylosuccinate synthase